MRNRLFTLILATLLVASTFTACGKNDNAVPLNHKEDTKIDNVDGATDTEQNTQADTGITEVVTEPVTEPEAEVALTAQEAFELFLSNDMTAQVPEDYYVFYENKDAYLYEIVNKTKNYALYYEWYGDMTLSRVTYSYIDAGSDGNPELEVSIWLDSYSSGEVNYDTVYRFDGEKIQMIAYASGGYRCMSYINNEGVIYSGGSGGAASYASDYSVILADGKVQPLYTLYSDSAMSKPMIPTYYLTDYPEGYEVNEWEFDNPYTMEQYFVCQPDLSAKAYYCFTDQYGNEVMPEAEYIELYESQGITIMTLSERDQLIRDLVIQYGLDPDRYGSDNAIANSLNISDYENVMGKNWVEAYKNYLSDNANFVDILSTYHGLFLSCEPQKVVGFTLAEITGDDIPELIILGVEAGGYTETTGQGIYIYSYNENNHCVEDFTFTSSLGSLPGWYNTDYLDLSGTVLNEKLNNYYCVTGLYNGDLVTFGNWGDIGYEFELYVNHMKNGLFEREVVYEYYIEDDWDEDGVYDVYETGDLDKAIEICENYTPLYFADITTENIQEYICEDYMNTVLNCSSAEEVVRAQTDYSLIYSETDTTNMWVNGYIDDYSGYNIENRMQFYRYSY